MRKGLMALILAMLLCSSLAFAGNAPGPQQDSGDGIPDGSAFFDPDYTGALPIGWSTAPGPGR